MRCSLISLNTFALTLLSWKSTCVLEEKVLIFAIGNRVIRWIHFPNGTAFIFVHTIWEVFPFIDKRINLLLWFSCSSSQQRLPHYTTCKRLHYLSAENRACWKNTVIVYVSTTSSALCTYAIICLFTTISIGNHIKIISGLDGLTCEARSNRMAVLHFAWSDAVKVGDVRKRCFGSQFFFFIQQYIQEVLCLIWFLADFGRLLEYLLQRDSD